MKLKDNLPVLPAPFGCIHIYASPYFQEYDDEEGNRVIGYLADDELLEGIMITEERFKRMQERLEVTA